MKTNIIDCSHYQVITNFDKIKESGIVAMIHKATEGMSYVDNKYQARKAGCKEAGIAFGAYHFLKGSGEAEAKRFVEYVNDKNMLLALDWELPNIPVQEAERFVETVFNLTGKYPLLYSYQSMLNTKRFSNDSILKNCKLWIARYGKYPTVPFLWDTFTIWQYSDKGRVNGITGFVDKNYFNSDDDNYVFKLFNFELNEQSDV